MIKRYNHLIFNKILLVYGREKAGKKYKERTLVFVLMPFVSVFIGFVLYFCSVGIASSFCCTAGLYAAACFLYDINIVKKAKRRCISMKFELADIIDRIADSSRRGSYAMERSRDCF